MDADFRREETRTGQKNGGGLRQKEGHGPGGQAGGGEQCERGDHIEKGGERSAHEKRGFSAYFPCEQVRFRVG